MKGKFNIIKYSLALLSCCLVATALAKTSINLKKIRVSETAATTQVLLELSQDFHYKVLELHNPERYVIDLYDVKLRAALPGKDLPAPLKALRTSTDKEKVRLVFDLETRVKPRVLKQAASGNRSPSLAVDFSRQFASASSADLKNLSKLTKKMAEHSAQVSKQNAQQPAFSVASTQKIKPIKLRPTISLGNLPKPSPVKAMKPRDVVIVIDPGHGGKDPGARGGRGTQEKDIVLAIAKRLQAHINQQEGFRAVLTRKGDYYIGLRERLALARKYQGDMFIAIHADAHEHVTACGVGVYALSQRGATSEATRWLAQRENQSEFVGGLDLADKDHDLRSVLIDLSQTQSITASLHMGSALLHHLGKFADLHHDTVEQAAFVVLKSPDIPSLLIETGFISNAEEEARLRRPFYQNRIAEALLLGIKNYFVQNPPRGSYLAVKAGKDYNV